MSIGHLHLSTQHTWLHLIPVKFSNNQEQEKKLAPTREGARKQCSLQVLEFELKTSYLLGSWACSQPYCFHNFCIWSNVFLFSDFVFVQGWPQIVIILSMPIAGLGIQLWPTRPGQFLRRDFISSDWHWSAVFPISSSPVVELQSEDSTNLRFLSKLEYLQLLTSHLLFKNLFLTEQKCHLDSLLSLP
jgi:hypothetical protein